MNVNVWMLACVRKDVLGCDVVCEKHTDVNVKVLACVQIVVLACDLVCGTIYGCTCAGGRVRSV